MTNAQDSTDLHAIASMGMLPAWQAERRAGQIALYSPRGNLSFGQLNERANRLAWVLRSAGLREGDGLVVVSPNAPLFIETYLAAQRSGIRLTPISPHLGPADLAYVVSNSGAEAAIVDAASVVSAAPDTFHACRLRLAGNGEVAGFANYDATLSRASSDPPPAPRHGSIMIYTSGTTGRPKGVYRKKGLIVHEHTAITIAGYREGDINLLCGPAYFGASLYYDVTLPLAAGIPIVLMERFDAEEFLRLIERHRITHTHVAPTMLRRLMGLSAYVRAKYDVTSLRVMMHGGAPTPIPLKRAIIEWLGPVLTEYYASTEGAPGIRISSEDWLRKPGSVGRLPATGGACVLNEEGGQCAPGEVGRVFFRRPDDARRPAYFRDIAETERVFGNDYFTVGDLGYVDEDDFLFLTGRVSDKIISGGVNISPQEIDDVLLGHPSVSASCCVGVPSDEWGEDVKALIVLREGREPTDALAHELSMYVRERLSPYKMPKSVEFVSELPYTETGKIKRSAVRARYWEGGRSI